MYNFIAELKTSMMTVSDIIYIYISIIHYYKKSLGDILVWAIEAGGLATRLG